MSEELWTEIAAVSYSALRVSVVQSLLCELWGLSVCLSNLKSLFLPRREHTVPHDKDETDGVVSENDRRLFWELHEIQWMRCVEQNLELI